MFSSLRRRLPRIGRLPRLLAAGICLLLAASSALGATRPRPRSASVAPVVVAARDLPAGSVLGHADLAVARWPARLRPAGARAGPQTLLGRRLAGPIRAREPVTDARLVGGALTRGLPAHTVAAPLLLDDPHAADVVQAGDRVTVLETPRAADPAAAAPTVRGAVTRVAEHVLVLAVLPGADDAAAEVVLAVDESTAVRITRDRPAQMFTLVVDPP
jgi:Flp pilus assembly protein CpaB